MTGTNPDRQEVGQGLPPALVSYLLAQGVAPDDIGQFAAFRALLAVIQNLRQRVAALEAKLP